MSGKQKKIDYRPWLGFLAVVVLVVVGSVAKAISYGNTITNSTVTINQQGTEATPVGEYPTIGAVAPATSTGATGWVPNIGVSEYVTYGTFGIDNLDNQQVGFIQKDCTDATSTLFAIQNTTGKKIVIDSFYFKLTGENTTTMTVTVATSSRAYIDISGGSPTPFVTLEDQGRSAVMGDFTFPTTTPTNTVWTLTDYPAVYKAAGVGSALTGTGIADSVFPTTRNPIVNEGDWMVGFATVTDWSGANRTSPMSAVTSTNSLFDCSVYGHYSILN